MRISLLAVGRIKSGPERTLIDDYVGRFRRIGPGIGLKDLTERVVESGGGCEREGERLLANLPRQGIAIRLDERAKPATSAEVARQIARYRDDGQSQLTYLIGGAEGFAERVRVQIPGAMAFGSQTWPHRLVRVMLAEQLYRAATILAGTPYHKA